MTVSKYISGKLYYITNLSKNSHMAYLLQ